MWCWYHQMQTLQSAGSWMPVNISTSLRSGIRKPRRSKGNRGKLDLSGRHGFSSAMFTACTAPCYGCCAVSARLASMVLLTFGTLSLLDLQSLCCWLSSRFKPSAGFIKFFKYRCNSCACDARVSLYCTCHLWLISTQKRHAHMLTVIMVWHMRQACAYSANTSCPVWRFMVILVAGKT